MLRLGMPGAAAIMIIFTAGQPWASHRPVQAQFRPSHLQDPTLDKAQPQNPGQGPHGSKAPAQGSSTPGLLSKRMGTTEQEERVSLLSRGHRSKETRAFSPTWPVPLPPPLGVLGAGHPSPGAILAV